MATIKVDWAIIERISIFDEARDLGFDLRKFADQSEDIRAAMKKSTVDQIIKKVRQAWRDSFEGGPDEEYDFNSVRNGVCVISICDGFGVKYRSGCSEIMYIGRGVISNRIRSHLNNWIFDMSLSLRNVSFKFYMDSVGDKRSGTAFKDFEHYMLREFSEKFGEKPLVNKIHGRTGRLLHTFEGNWASPLDNRGKHYLWEIRPTKRNTWFKEYQDE